MSDEDRRKWDARYREQAAAKVEPADFLVSIADRLPARGRAVDVAGGAGRHAVWLARRGLEVTLLDISTEALHLAEQAAESAGVDVATRQIDLETDPFPPGPWDVIFSHHFLQRSLFAVYAEVLAPGGLLAVCQPTITNLERHARPPRRFLLTEGELRQLAGPLEILQYEERWCENGRHEARLVARRRRLRRRDGDDAKPSLESTKGS